MILVVMSLEHDKNRPLIYFQFQEEFYVTISN